MVLGFGAEGDRATVTFVTIRYLTTRYVYMGNSTNPHPTKRSIRPCFPEIGRRKLYRKDGSKYGDRNGRSGLVEYLDWSGWGVPEVGYGGSFACMEKVEEGKEMSVKLTCFPHSFMDAPSKDGR